MTCRSPIRCRTLACVGIFLLLTRATGITDGAARSDAATPGKPVSTSSGGTPVIPGFDLAGRCIPANHVGGDHFTYRWLDAAQTKLAIIVADVSGKEMKAAMTVMRFAEVLHYELQG